jgi:acetyl-CoA C-acetyltransferase
MKSVMLAAQAIQCGDAEIVVAGGMHEFNSALYESETELNLVPLP